MKKIVASILITALALGAMYGAVYGGAATIGLGGVDRLDGGSVAVTDLACGARSGLISGSVTCTIKTK